MDKKKAISILVLLAVVATAVAAFVMWPKRYTVGQHMAQTVVFWNDHDAFLFLTLNSTGRSRNVLQSKLDGPRYAYLTLLAGGLSDFNKQDVVAYHLVASGQLDRFNLPERTVTYGPWTLSSGHLQLTPLPSISGEWLGTRWDGEEFVPVPAPLPQAPARTQSSSNS
ncbi:MAG: hypothetical protein ACXVZX_16630, partial [Terriglobales bacterium]